MVAQPKRIELALASFARGAFSRLTLSKLVMVSLRLNGVSRLPEKGRAHQKLLTCTFDKRTKPRLRRRRTGFTSEANCKRNTFHCNKQGPQVHHSSLSSRAMFFFFKPYPTPRLATRPWRRRICGWMEAPERASPQKQIGDTTRVTGTKKPQVDNFSPPCATRERLQMARTCCGRGLDVGSELPRKTNSPPPSG